MFETILLSDDTDNALTDAILATVIATATALLLVQTVIPFKIGGVDLGGLIAVFFTSLALSYPLTRYIKRRDIEEITSVLDEPHLLRRHAEEVQLYLAAFLVATFIFAASVLILPESFYTIQYTVLNSLGSLGGSVSGTGFIAADSFFMSIVTNNTGLFFATFALSFLISGGMVFIIIWNASILGVLIGATSSHVLDIPVRTAPYLVHGSIEIIAYILAGLAGTLLAIDTETLLMTEESGSKHYIRPVRDASTMLALGLLLIVLAGLIEA